MIGPNWPPTSKALCHGDTLVVWKLDRLERDLRHLVNIVHDLTERGIGLKVRTGPAAELRRTVISSLWLLWCPMLPSPWRY